MSDADDQTVLPTDWEAFQVETELAVPFTAHADPTELYSHFLNSYGAVNAAALEPYSNHVDVFTTSLELAAIFLPHRSSNILSHAWKDVVHACFRGELQDRYASADAEMLRAHLIRITKTPPTTFGEQCVQLKKRDRIANFKLAPVEGAGVVADEANARHDIVLWLVCFDLGGKVFELEDWQSEYVESLLPEEDQDQTVIEITYGRETISVTRSAQAAMSEALTGMSTRPPIYVNCLQIFSAVAKILGKDLLEYAMPQSKEELESFNWNDVVVGNKETYPKAPLPPIADVKKINLVYDWQKEQKDIAARASGAPHAGVPKMATLRLRWRRWLRIHAIFRTMYPNESLETVANRVTIATKASTSEPDMDKRITDEVRLHIQARKRATKKREVDQKLAAAQQEEAAAKVRAQQLQEQVAAAQAQRQQIELRDLGTFGRTRNLQRQAKEYAIQTQENQVKVARQSLQEIQLQAREKAAQRAVLQTTKRGVEKEDRISKKKKIKRNDVNRLERITPRQKAADDAMWKPPTFTSRNQCEEPGQSWKDDSITKLALLQNLRSALMAESLIDPELTFSLAMDYLSLDESNSTYQERVFVFLLCLLVRQQSSFSDTILIVSGFVEEGWSEVATLAGETAVNIQAKIDDTDDDNDTGAAIHKVVTALHVGGGDIPTSRAGLIALDLNDTMVSLLMQHVYGSSELVVGLDARKIVTALDMIDWEETGVKQKAEVKMTNVSSARVKRSLLTWLPKGSTTTFHDTMSSIGDALSSKQFGIWGKVKNAITRHFAPKHKEQVVLMAETISQFYKATKSGGRKTVTI